MSMKKDLPENENSRYDTHMAPTGILWFLTLIICALVGLLVFLYWQSKQKKTPSSRTLFGIYHKKEFFLTKREREFFQLLYQLYGHKYHIVPQVNLDKVLYVQSPYARDRGYRSKIDRKSFDFVFLSQAYLQPLVAIELDDSTHQSPERQKRDGVVEEICADSELPLVRFSAGAFPTPEEIQVTLRRYMIEV